MFDLTVSWNTDNTKTFLLKLQTSSLTFLEFGLQTFFKKNHRNTLVGHLFKVRLMLRSFH